MTNPKKWGVSRISTKQWRIQDFPHGAAPLWVWGKNLLFDKIFAKTCIKMKEISPREARPSPLPWIRQC